MATSVRSVGSIGLNGVNEVFISEARALHLELVKARDGRAAE